VFELLRAQVLAHLAAQRRVELPSGSSISHSAGLRAIARASATRC
jgi:hypothetical protein